MRSPSPPPQGLAWLGAIREPERALSWPIGEWERVVRMARRLRLLSRLAEALDSEGSIDRVPPQARRHLIAEQRLSRWRIAAAQWTLERVAVAIGDAPYPRVLLKGAAYIEQQLPVAAGRLPSDLDILVPRQHLADAQGRLKDAGWREYPLDAHDRRYYLEWSHEVPPMRHPLLALELDLHHNILPPVARTNVDADLLLERLRPTRRDGWHVLEPADQVLHSAAHLFLDSELRDRLRDLVDLDGLLRRFGAERGFWQDLPLRAARLGLTEPLALACHFCARWLGTPVPEDAAHSTAEILGRWRYRRWLLPLLERALLPTEPDHTPAMRQSLAATVLAARYHRQRMPMRLLAPHLWHKFKVGALGPAAQAAEPGVGRP